MKKSIFAIAAFCAVTMCFCACKEVEPNEPDEYELLNAKLSLNYSRVVITVTDTFDSDSYLISSYTVSRSDDGVKVNYSIERFAEISLENPPSDDKVMTLGEVVIKDGVVVSGDKDVIGALPDGINFKEEYFENAVLEKSSFKADVKNAAGFLDTSIKCTDMEVTAYFNEAFSNITVTYVSESGNSVKYIYEFGI